MLGNVGNILQFSSTLSVTCHSMCLIYQTCVNNCRIDKEGKSILPTYKYDVKHYLLP